MKRAFNYTDRSKINEKAVTIALESDEDKIESFTISLDMEGISIAEGNEVFVEAYYRTEYERFSLGKASEISEETEFELGSIGYTENIKFRILAVEDGGRITALARSISPVSGQSKPLLPVEPRDLGRQVWEVQYRGEDGAPILAINQKIPSITDAAKNDAKFILGVYPSVLREVLFRLIFVEEIGDTTNVDIEWQEDWLRFTEEITGEERPESLDPDQEGFPELEDWITDVVERFASKRHKHWKEIREGWD